MDLDLKDPIQFTLFMNHAFEPRTRARADAYLRLGDLFIEVVVANVRPVFLHGSQKGGPSIVLEPNARICAALVANRAANF
jgi:hypothetical protein